MSSPRKLARLPAHEAPRLLVLVDVEEEFDWAGPFDRSRTGCGHVGALLEVDPIFAEHGIVPTAVCTHPVVEDEAAADVLRQLVDTGRWVVGAHLHPWVTPPFDEPVDAHHSFPGNLPRALESAKLAALTARIERAVGARPTVYQAGRYGLGPRTASVLEEHGYTVDMSVCPPFDYSSEGGPDYSRDGNDPFWFGDDPPLLEIPVTGGVVGRAGQLAAPLYRAASGALMRALRFPGVLARTGLAERLRLSPEGQTADDMLRLVRALLAEGTRVFTLSFHSPSLRPGHTAYVRSAAERDEFLERLRRFLASFTGELGGVPTTPDALRDELLAAAPPAPRGRTERT
ncbi:MAG: polysaccharide deacetylase family protein [Planctomycetes bacterium]|nr:polysaccharide deacetylase family protein [Planctomycetota bacterium]